MTALALDTSALAKTLGGMAITTGRPWQALDLGIAIECIRPDSH